MIRNAQSDGAASFMLQAPRRFARGLEQKGVRTRCVRTQQPVLPIVDHCILTDLGEVAAYQGEMMVPIRLPNIANALQSRLVADMAAERVAGVGGIDDHPSPAQSLDGLAHEAPLRGHGMQLQVDTHFVAHDTRMNQSLEWLPLIVFFVGLKLRGIYWATVALMIACVLQLPVPRFPTGTFKPMHIITGAVVLVLGSATLLLHDRRFIQWEPPVLLALAAAAFLGSLFFGLGAPPRRLPGGGVHRALARSPRPLLLCKFPCAGP